MKCLIIAIIAHTTFAGSVMAGRPIIMTEAQACAGADLVIIATISQPEDIPSDTDDPFGGWGSSWHHFGFTKVAKVKVEGTLLGTASDELSIYGGKLGAGTDFRIEEGRFLVLMTKVKDDAYRAVDWHYSFAPIKDGKVGWLIGLDPENREWITQAEALRRIEAHKAETQVQGSADQPATSPKSEPSGNEKPKPESKPRPQ